MKISKLLKGLLLPLVIFAFVGSPCPGGDDVEPELCRKFTTSRDNLYRLTGPAATVEFKTGPAEGSCKASFYVVFGWKDPARFTSPSEVSPMDNALAGLKLTFGEDTYGKTFFPPNPVKKSGESPYDFIKGTVWTMDLEVSPVVSDPGGTTYYVKIEHTILEDEDYDFFVEVKIKYSELQ
jgi:hypothetical protein